MKTIGEIGQMSLFDFVKICGKDKLKSKRTTSTNSLMVYYTTRTHPRSKDPR
jgi:hypothetical protein